MCPHIFRLQRLDFGISVLVAMYLSISRQSTSSWLPSDAAHGKPVLNHAPAKSASRQLRSR
jgi:hypothetical protein